VLGGDLEKNEDRDSRDNVAHGRKSRSRQESRIAGNLYTFPSKIAIVVRREYPRRLQGMRQSGPRVRENVRACFNVI